MNKLIRRLRGAVGMGVTWGLGWGIAGIGIGVASLLPKHPFGPFLSVMDAPLPALALPGFFAGLFFSAVLGVAGRRRRFRDLSVRRFAAWGAAGGALLVLFPFFLVAIGLASAEGSRHQVPDIIAAIAPVFIALSTASAVGSLLFARRAEDRASRAADAPGEPALDELGPGPHDLGSESPLREVEYERR